MQKRSFLLLLGATIVLVAAAIFALASGERTLTTAHTRRAFPDLAAKLGDLAWVRVSHGATTANFAQIGGHWAMAEKGNYPAAPGKLRRLLLGLADLTLVEPKTTRPDLFARLGLDDPSNGKSTLIALQDRIGKTVAQLIVGKVRRDRLGGGNTAVYFRKPGDNRTWLARGDLDLPADMAGWLDRRILDIPGLRIASIALTGSDGTALVLRRDKAVGKFAVADPPPDAKFKGDAALAAPAAALTGLDLDDVKPRTELPVPDSGVASAVFTTFDGLTVNLRLFTSGNADWIAIDAAGTGAAKADGTALGKKLARWTYAIPADRAKLLRTTLADLLAPPKGS
jgi:hypothetical protein